MKHLYQIKNGKIEKVKVNYLSETHVQDTSCTFHELDKYLFDTGYHLSWEDAHEYLKSGARFKKISARGIYDQAVEDERVILNMKDPERLN